MSTEWRSGVTKTFIAMITILSVVTIGGCAAGDGASSQDPANGSIVTGETDADTGSGTSDQAEKDKSNSNDARTDAETATDAGSKDNATGEEGNTKVNTGADGTSEKDEEWRKAYKEYIESQPSDEGFPMSYALIYVDNDDIPELAIDTGSEAGGCQILTYHNGVMDVLQTSRLYFTYIEKENLLNNCDGHMGYYFDAVYTIKDGKWTVIFHGEYSGFDENSEEIDYDEETGRYHCLNYLVDGKEVDEAAYMQQLNKVYDLKKEKAPESYLLYDDMMSYLNTGKYIYEGHRYELCVEDCTWDEAEKKCKEKGGYLASLTCDGEFKHVEDMIRNENKTDNCFYIGAKQEDYSWIWTEPDLTVRDCVTAPYYKHWLNGGPSYTEMLEDGTEIEETRVELLYRKTEDAFYMNDIPNDVISNYPSFKGRIGYICEYSSK
ncbi:MAG: C-type lectin domain-containing protein [Lachnospiraceae bacterium]|nr:C-type lectin domain-containing protein [Lachnospiraceae bacterium]